MGKNYWAELTELQPTFEWASSLPVEPLMQFVEGSQDCPLFVVASGGSMTCAVLAAALHRRYCSMALAVTPQDFLSMSLPFQDAAVLLVSAGGNNEDILTSYETAVMTEVREVMGLCLAAESKLEKAFSKFPCTRFMSHPLPSGKDGFLATNSVMAFSALLLEAYDRLFHIKDHPGATLSLGDNEHPDALSTAKKDTWIVLYSDWSKPAAIDLYTRASEAALANVQVVDYRNFRHGRHFWLHTRTDSTTVVAMLTPQTTDLAERMLSKLPPEVECLRLSTGLRGPQGTVELISKSMHLAGYRAKHLKRNPGRPGVPSFGRALFHSPLRIKRSVPTTVQQAIIRKARKRVISQLSPEQLNFWTTQLRQFASALSSAQIRCLVVDYDGTLCDTNNRFQPLTSKITTELVRLLSKGTALGIATGRGVSASEGLRNTIPEKYWSQVTMGYYNGTAIAALDDLNAPLRESTKDELLLSAQSRIAAISEIANLRIESRPMQLSVSSAQGLAIRELKRIIAEQLQHPSLTGLKLVASAHSIDILPPGAGKATLIEHMCETLGVCTESQVLTIGDSGDWMGNDYDLLSVPLSLSVDKVSSNPSTCWNLAPIGFRGSLAASFYLSRLNGRGKQPLSFQLPDGMQEQLCEII